MPPNKSADFTVSCGDRDNAATGGGDTIELTRHYQALEFGLQRNQMDVGNGREKISVLFALGTGENGIGGPVQARALKRAMLVIGSRDGAGWGAEYLVASRKAHAAAAIVSSASTVSSSASTSSPSS
jgi:hypothetical protein